MESYALLLAATLNAGTVLAIAALGLLINEKAGIVNLGAEGMMLVRRHRRLRDRRAHRQRLARLRWPALAAGALLAAVFGVLVIWLNTNQYATGLALSLFGAGFSAFVGISYTQEKLPERPQLRASRCWPTSRSSARRCSASIRWSTSRSRSTVGAGLVPLPLARRPGAARGRRVARVGACARLPGAPHPLLAVVVGRRAVRAGRAPTCRSSTRRCGSRAWSPARAGSRWRSPPSPPGGRRACCSAPTCSAASRCCSSTCRAQGVRGAEPVPDACCRTSRPIVVLALISRNPAFIRINMPASHRQAVLPRLIIAFAFVSPPTCSFEDIDHD